MNELLTDVALVIASLLFGVGGERMNEHLKQRRKEVRALRRLDALSQQVASDVAHGHRFERKIQWAEELKHFATDVGWLDDINRYDVTRLAWQIADRSFSHRSGDSQNYCCDELIADLAALRLRIASILWRDSWPRRSPSRQQVARLLETLRLCAEGVGSFRRVTLPEEQEGHPVPKQPLDADPQLDPELERLLQDWTEHPEQTLERLRRGRGIGRAIDSSSR